jgi:hypothetical protein
MRFGRSHSARLSAFSFIRSGFNRLASPRYRIRVGDARLHLRSEFGDLFTFDFQSGGPFPESRAQVALTTKGGRINGIAQWIFLQMDPAGAIPASAQRGPPGGVARLGASRGD